MFHLVPLEDRKRINEMMESQLSESKEKYAAVLHISPGVPRGFKTKKFLKEFVKDLIDECIRSIGMKDGVCLISKNKKCFTFFVDLFERHPEFMKKIGGREFIDDVFIHHNVAFKNLEIGTMVSGKKIVISYNACISQSTGTGHSNLRLAMRTAVKQQILRFRKKQKQICTECKSMDKLQVDHVSPLFEELVLSFLKGRTSPTKFSEKSGSNMICFRNEDNEFKSQWQEYHRKHADLQFLCSECHKKKTASCKKTKWVPPPKKRSNKSTVSLLEEQGLL